MQGYILIKSKAGELLFAESFRDNIDSDGSEKMRILPDALPAKVDIFLIIYALDKILV